MGIVKFGIRMLLNEKKQSISYLLSMIFATALILNSFNIIFNTDFLENDSLDLKGTAIKMAIIVVIGASLFVIISSLYFIYGKAELLSISLLSGRSIYSVGVLLAVQNLFLGIIGIILGTIVGICLIPLSNTLAYLGIGQDITLYEFSTYGFATTIFVFVTVLICVSTVGMGYVFRKELVELLKDQKMKHKKKESMLNFKINGIFWWVLYFFPVVLLLVPISIEEKSKLIPAAEFVTLISIVGLVKVSIPELINHYKRKYCKYDKIKTIAISNLLGILDGSKYLILYLLFAIREFVLCYIDSLTTDKVRVVVMICYAAVIISISTTMMYKIIIEGENRKNSFKQLNLIGYTKNQINKTLTLEVSLFYLIVMMIPLVQILAMIVTSPMAGAISVGLTASMIAIFICLFLAAFIISLKEYKKVVFRNLEGEK